MADVEYNSTTGRANLYLRFKDLDTDEFWNGSAFESWANGNVATYAVAFPEIGGGNYGTSVPAGITAPRNLGVAVYDNASPAISDVSEADGTFDWRGSKLGFGTAGKPNLI